MPSVEDLEQEMKLLLESNNEMVHKVQFWKVKFAEQEKEKLNLVKEINELKLKVIRMCNGGPAQTQALAASLKETTSEALSHLVQTSNAVTRILDLVDSYIKDRLELESSSSRWSNLSNNSCTQDKVHRVPPTLVGGRTTQPYVALRRVSLSAATSNQNVSDTVLPLPMHLLQDVYIPLRRIDTEVNIEVPDIEDNYEQENNESLLGDSDGDSDDSHNLSIEENKNNILHVLQEEPEETVEEIVPTPASLNPIDNPLEGPSWLLDNLQRPSPVLMKRSRNNKRVALEADSTTEPDEPRANNPSPAVRPNTTPPEEAATTASTERHVFTPTVRRRKRTVSPPPSPMLPANTYSMKSRTYGRVLKVMVPKMRLECLKDAGGAGGSRGGGDATPPKRVASFDAPSPNGATDSALIEVEQSRDETNEDSIRERAQHNTTSAAERDSDSGGEGSGRTRRQRKQVTYKEKPLNRKLRR